MNYPTVLQNPMVRKRERLIESRTKPAKAEREHDERSNYELSYYVFGNF